MGHLLSTTNPKAAARINDEGRPMPGIAETVLYHPRAGEVRQGRKTVPAIVLKVDEENRQLELLIIHAADDMITQNRVPEHVEGDRGWSRVPAIGDAAKLEAAIERIAILEEKLATYIESLFADFVVPEGESVMSLIDKLDGRIGEIEEKPAHLEKIASAQAKTNDGIQKRYSRRAKRS